MQWYTCQISLLVHFKKKALQGFAAKVAADPTLPRTVQAEYSDPLFGRPDPVKEDAVKDLLRSPICVFVLPGGDPDGNGLPAYSQCEQHLQGAIAAYNALNTGLTLTMGGPDPDCWRIIYENGVCEVVYNCDLTPSIAPAGVTVNGTYQVGVHIKEPLA